jgi:hypothetical protein
MSPPLSLLLCAGALPRTGAVSMTADISQILL